MPFLSYKATNRAGLSPHVAYCVNTLLSARLRVQQVLCAAWEYVLEIRDVGARSVAPHAGSFPPLDWLCPGDWEFLSCIGLPHMSVGEHDQD